MSKVWLVTGASKGFGLEFARQILAKGDKVAATSRNVSELEKLVGKHDNFLPLEMDLVDENKVKEAVSKTIATFGKIDVVINNAGYGLVGTLEELSDAEARRNFDVNVFGTLNVIRNVLPVMRKQESGHIINFSSVGGYLGDFPGFGIYCATKFAVTGLTESLATEVQQFNIKATVVLPGYFRTNFLESDSLVLPENAIPAYTSARESERLHKEEINRNQAGDPVKGAKAVIDIVSEENPPLHFFLGSDAYQMSTQKANTMLAELDAWKTASYATDFEKAEA